MLEKTLAAQGKKKRKEEKAKELERETGEEGRLNIKGKRLKRSLAPFVATSVTCSSKEHLEL